MDNLGELLISIASKGWKVHFEGFHFGMGVTVNRMKDWPEWKRNILVQSGKPTVETPRKSLKLPPSSKPRTLAEDLPGSY